MFLWFHIPLEILRNSDAHVVCSVHWFRTCLNVHLALHVSTRGRTVSQSGRLMKITPKPLSARKRSIHFLSCFSVNAHEYMHAASSDWDCCQSCMKAKSNIHASGWGETSFPDSQTGLTILEMKPSRRIYCVKTDFKFVTFTFWSKIVIL